MKTHFATVELGNENQSHDEWSEPLCGTYSDKVDNDWSVVTCKRCLCLKDQYINEMKFAMQESCRDMENFVKFVQTNKI